MIQAAEIARQEIMRVYELTEEEMSAYEPHVSFFTTDSFPEPRWEIAFCGEGETMENARFRALLTKDGEITEAIRELGILTPIHARKLELARSTEGSEYAICARLRLNEQESVYYNAQGGKHYHFLVNCPGVQEKYWPLSPISKEDALFEKLTPCPWCVQNTMLWSLQDRVKYNADSSILPGEAWITPEEAEEIARKALADMRFSLEGLFPRTVSAQVNGRYIYAVYFLKLDMDESDNIAVFDTQYYVNLDAITGEVISAGLPKGNG